MNGTFFFLWFLPDLVPRPSLPSFGEGPCDAWERSRHHLGKAPMMPGEGPGNIWGRSSFMPRTFPIEMPPQCPLIPIPRGRSPTSNSTFPKYPYHHPHLPLGPSPFALRTCPVHSTGTCPICPRDLPPFTLPGPVPFALKTSPHSLSRDLSPFTPPGPSPEGLSTQPEGR